jgi:hypothetical protein
LANQTQKGVENAVDDLMAAYPDARDGATVTLYALGTLCPDMKPLVDRVFASDRSTPTTTTTWSVPTLHVA